MFELSYHQQKKASELGFKTLQAVLEKTIIWSGQAVKFFFKYLNLMIRQGLGK